jgi:hypothetical protein
MVSQDLGDRYLALACSLCHGTGMCLPSDAAAWRLSGAT